MKNIENKERSLKKRRKDSKIFVHGIANVTQGISYELTGTVEI